MFAVIRATLGAEPAADWPDALVHALFDPHLPFSFAHYWSRNSFGEADMRYHLFAPIAYADPREGKVHGEARQALVEQALKEVTRRFDPDWDLFEGALLLFSGTVDLFGGGRYALPTRPGSERASITAAVMDTQAPFSSLVQEIGHAFGYDHEVGSASVAQEYASPYSAMSEQFWPKNTFMRPADPRLTQLPEGALGRDEPLREIGPYIPAAQFLAAGSPTLNHPQSVVTAPEPLSSPWPVRLCALDRAIDEWPARRTCVAVIPASPQRLRTYYLEVRRKSGYDQGLNFGLDGRAAAGLVIHSWDPATGRVHYEGALAFGDQAGDLDYRSFAGRFIVRLVGYDAERGEASLRVLGDDAWRLSGVDLDGPHVDERGAVYGAWTAVEATPCGPASAGTYEFRTVAASTEVRVSALSHGFERPAYEWRLQGEPLVGTSGRVVVRVAARRIEGTALVDAGVVDCEVTFVASQNALTLSTSSPWASMNLQLQVQVSETSPEVLRNAYPPRLLTAEVRVDNQRIEWDDRYTRAKVQCWRKYWHQDKGFKPGQVRPVFDREPQKIDPRVVDPGLIDAVLDVVRGGEVSLNPQPLPPGERPWLSPRERLQELQRVDLRLGPRLPGRLDFHR